MMKQKPRQSSGAWAAARPLTVQLAGRFRVGGDAARQNDGGQRPGPGRRQGATPMLEPLFDAELDYQTGMPPLTSEGDGALIGSGDGAVLGPKLTGKLEWTLFEQPGSTVCRMAPVARITTDDGARIRFDGRGYGTRLRPDGPNWRVP